MQSRAHSILESFANIAVGYTVAVVCQIILFPLLFDIHVAISTNMYIGFVFTIISLVRSYALRRFFTKRTERVCECVILKP